MKETTITNPNVIRVGDLLKSYNNSVYVLQETDRTFLWLVTKKMSSYFDAIKIFGQSTVDRSGECRFSTNDLNRYTWTWSKWV